jgi:hypothetical protein
LSPILVRPVREQLEHDRVIRLLEAKYRKKFDVAVNLGPAETTPVVIGASQWYPDLVLLSPDRARKPLGTVEVETAESVNHLEAMSQWATFARLRAPLHLYVPAASIDTARRLCLDLHIPVAEIWAFSSLGDQIRFALVHRSARATEARARATQRPAKDATRGAPRARASTRKTAAVKSSRRASTGKATNKTAKTKAAKAVASRAPSKTATSRSKAATRPNARKRK